LKTWYRCHNFFISSKNWRKNAFLLKLLCTLQKNYHNIWFSDKRQFFRRKLAKIIENCDRWLTAEIWTILLSGAPETLPVRLVWPRGSGTENIIYISYIYI
jgi:hypothetical protein